MKSNKIRIFKYIIVSVFEFIISAILSVLIYEILYNVSYYLYMGYKIPLINNLFKVMFRLNDNVFNGAIYSIIGLSTFILIYGAITYRKYSSLSQIVYDLELMSKGNFDNNIKVKSNGDIGQVAENINDIVKKLKI